MKGALYRHQPQRGIPQARNAALDAARELGATHVAFIDDDETAAPDWLAALWAAMVESGADAVLGCTRYIYPADASPWRCGKGNNASKHKTGDILERLIQGALKVLVSPLCFAGWQECWAPHFFKRR